MFEQTVLFGQSSAHPVIEKPSKEIAGLIARTSLLKNTEEKVQYLLRYLNDHHDWNLYDLTQIKILCLEEITKLTSSLQPKYCIEFSEIAIGKNKEAQFDSIEECLEQIAEVEICTDYTAKEQASQNSTFQSTSLSALKEDLCKQAADIKAIYHAVGQLKELQAKMERSSLSQDEQELATKKREEKEFQLLDQVKQLKQELSDQVLQEAERFIQAAVTNGQNTAPIFEIKEEIKQFQQLIKQFPLFTKTFHKIRKELGELWHELKQIEKSKKQEKKQQQKEAKKLSQNLDKIAQSNSSPQQLHNPVQQASRAIKKTNLLKTDRKKLEEKLETIQKPIGQENAKAIDLKEKINSQEPLISADLFKQFDAFETKIQELQINSRDLSSLYDALDRWINKSIAKVIESSQDAVFLNQHRGFLKKQLDQFKKQHAKSNLDFEQSFLLTNRINHLKESVEKIDRVLA